MTLARLHYLFFYCSSQNTRELFLLTRHRVHASCWLTSGPSKVSETSWEFCGAQGPSDSDNHCIISAPDSQEWWLLLLAWRSMLKAQISCNTAVKTTLSSKIEKNNFKTSWLFKSQIWVHKEDKYRRGHCDVLSLSFSPPKSSSLSQTYLPALLHTEFSSRYALFSKASLSLWFPRSF